MNHKRSRPKHQRMACHCKYWKDERMGGLGMEKPADRRHLQDAAVLVPVIDYGPFREEPSWQELQEESKYADYYEYDDDHSAYCDCLDCEQPRLEDMPPLKVTIAEASQSS